MWLRRRVADRWLAMVKLAFGVAVLLMCVTDRYGGLLNFATPFLWLVAARPANAGADPRYVLARALLALLGVIQVLYAYPVAGSQVAFVAVFMIVVAGICFWDGLSWTPAQPARKRAPNRTPNLVTHRRPGDRGIVNRRPQPRLRLGRTPQLRIL